MASAARGGRRGLCVACARLQAFALRLVGESLARLSRRATTDPADKRYGLPPSSFGEGACSAHDHSRGVESREVRVAIRFTRFGRSPSWRIPSRFVGRRSVELPCTSRRFRCGPRMLILRTWCRPPRWKNLNQKVPTSDVLCRFSGTGHRLQPTHRCPNRRPLARLRKLTADDRWIHPKSQHRLAPRR